MGRHQEARQPLALASQLQPHREVYRKCLEQSRRRAAWARFGGAPA
jgi:hypothetical protein